MDSLELPVSLGDVGLKGVEYQKNKSALPPLDGTSIGSRRNALDYDVLLIIMNYRLYVTV